MYLLEPLCILLENLLRLHLGLGIIIVVLGYIGRQVMLTVGIFILILGILGLLGLLFLHLEESFSVVLKTLLFLLVWIDVEDVSEPAGIVPTGRKLTGTQRSVL